MSSGSMAGQYVWMAVTGGRSYQDYAHIKRILDEERPGVVVQGECPYGGADALAKRWCEERGVTCLGMPAWFKFFGRSAGPLRNEAMLDLLPIYKVIAFPGDRGTNNCVDNAIKREILVRDERHATPQIPAGGLL